MTLLSHCFPSSQWSFVVPVILCSRLLPSQPQTKALLLRATTAPASLLSPQTCPTLHCSGQPPLLSPAAQHTALWACTQRGSALHHCQQGQSQPSCKTLPDPTRDGKHPPPSTGTVGAMGMENPSVPRVLRNTAGVPRAAQGASGGHLGPPTALEGP